MPEKPEANDVRPRAQKIYAVLAKRYPDPRPALTYADAWGLLVATVLAAQCTDARVNRVTPALFRRWPKIADLADADLTEIEAVVRSTGFFHNKAKNLKAAARRIVDVYGGEVPQSMAELTTLPGVARKTANIVLGNVFGIHEGIAVDTHVKRLSFRLGFTASRDPLVIERELMPLFDREQWNDVNHYLVDFGREVCTARAPQCSGCPLAELCPRLGVAA